MPGLIEVHTHSLARGEWAQAPRILRFLDCTPFAPGRSLQERLRDRRRTLGLSQRELGRRLGVDESTLARWERGTRRPSQALLERLKAVLPSL